MNDSGVRAGNEQVPAVSSTKGTFLAVILLVALLGAMVYLYFLCINELSMLMLGRMRVGYEHFLYQHLFTWP